MNNHLLRLLAGPLDEIEHQKHLPYFLSQHEQEQYRVNLINQPHDWSYRNTPVTYSLNKDKYRTHEWDNIDWPNSIVILGCSHVFGEANALDETIAYHMEMISGIKVINLGVSGTSPLYSWNNSLIMNNLFPTPRAVIQLWSHHGRIMYFARDKTKRLGPWSGSAWDNQDEHSANLYDLWNQDQTNAITHFKFIATAAKEFWSNKTCYIQSSYYDQTCDMLLIPRLPKIDKARDLMHYGTQTHYNAAKQLLKELT